MSEPNNEYLKSQFDRNNPPNNEEKSTTNGKNGRKRSSTDVSAPKKGQPSKTKQPLLASPSEPTPKPKDQQPQQQPTAPTSKPESQVPTNAQPTQEDGELLEQQHAQIKQQMKLLENRKRQLEQQQNELAAQESSDFESMYKQQQQHQQAPYYPQHQSQQQYYPTQQHQSQEQSDMAVLNQFLTTFDDSNLSVYTFRRLRESTGPPVRKLAAKVVVVKEYDLFEDGESCSTATQVTFKTITPWQEMDLNSKMKIEVGGGEILLKKDKISSVPSDDSVSFY